MTGAWRAARRGRPSLTSAVSILGAALTWWACAAGPAPRDHFYRMVVDPPGVAPKAPSMPGTLEVRRFDADALTGERALVYRHRDDPFEVHRHDYEYWLDPPTTMLQHALVGYLRGARVADVVLADAGAVQPDWVVSGRILRMERVLGDAPPSVSVELELEVRRQSDRALVWMGTYRVEGEAEGDGVSRSVDAFGRATGELFRRFVEDVSSL